MVMVGMAGAFWRADAAMSSIASALAPNPERAA